jgi:uncharacterized repeat protein (TIGR03803 family)
VLKEFTGGDGALPAAGLTLAAGSLYGTTTAGGHLGCGTVFKLDLSVSLGIQPSSGGVVLRWADPAFALQSSPAVAGPYITILGASSPYTNTASGPQQFFRLIGN